MSKDLDAFLDTHLERMGTPEGKHLDDWRQPEWSSGYNLSGKPLTNAELRDIRADGHLRIEDGRWSLELSSGRKWSGVMAPTEGERGEG